MACTKAQLRYARKWRKNNPLKYRLSVKKWQLKNPEKGRQYNHNAYLKYREQRLAYQKIWTQKNRRRIFLRTKIRKTENPSMFIFQAARARSKKNKIPFNITVKDIKVPEFCPIFGKKLVWGTKASHEFSPSLDRINPRKGYIKGNVIVISHRANCIKRDATLNELKQLVKFYSKYKQHYAKHTCS